MIRVLGVYLFQDDPRRGLGICQAFMSVLFQDDPRRCALGFGTCRSLIQVDIASSSRQYISSTLGPVSHHDSRHTEQRPGMRGHSLDQSFGFMNLPSDVPFPFSRHYISSTLYPVGHHDVRHTENGPGVRRHLLAPSGVRGCAACARGNARRRRGRRCRGR